MARNSGKPPATERFHPVNSRIATLKKIQKLSDAQLEFYLALGVFAVAESANSFEQYERWSGGCHPYKRVELLRDWVRLKQQQLLRERDRRINYHRRILNGKQATKISSETGGFTTCPRDWTVYIDEAGRFDRITRRPGDADQSA